MPPRRPTDDDVTLGARLRELRRSRSVSQEALAAALGVSFQQVQKYETGANRLGAIRLSEIAVFLGVPVVAFFPPLDPDAVGVALDGLCDQIRMLSPGSKSLVHAFVTELAALGR